MLISELLKAQELISKQEGADGRAGGPDALELRLTLFKRFETNWRKRDVLFNSVIRKITDFLFLHCYIAEKFYNTKIT